MRIKDNSIFSVKTLKVHYTTYDVRRDYDTINPDRRCFVMVHSPETETDPDASPYWYAQVLGIYHTEALCLKNGNIPDEGYEAIEFLWVRWLGS